MPYVYTTVYEFNIQSCCAIFAALCIAATLSVPIPIFQEKWAYKHWTRHRNSTSSPEHRLFFVCPQSLLIPIGIFIFGCTARADIHPAALALGLMIAACGNFAVYLAAFNYLTCTAYTRQARWLRKAFVDILRMERYRCSRLSCIIE